MFTSKDGMKKAGSKFVTDKYDKFHGPDEHKAEPITNAFGESKKSQPAAKNKQDEGMNHEEHDPKQVVSEHGKATNITIHHDDVAGKHKVMSHHPDGHMEESDHASAAEAHEHGKQLAGADENPEENPEDEFGGSQADNSSGDMASFGLGSQAV